MSLMPCMCSACSSLVVLMCNSLVLQVVKRIDMWGLSMVFVVGGNGGNAGANAIHERCVREGVHCAVIGIPKSIDNDILLVDRCFGFDTAVEEAQRALQVGAVYFVGGCYMHTSSRCLGTPSSTIC